HEARVTSRATEIHQTTLGQNHHAVAIGEHPLVILRLDVDLLDALPLAQASHVDLVVEVTDVGDDRLVLHLRHVLGGHDVEDAGRGDEDVGRGHHVLHRLHFVPLHCRLQRADRIDLGDNHAAALTAQRFRAPLAHFTEAEHHGDFAAEHDVGGAVQTINH